MRSRIFILFTEAKNARLDIASSAFLHLEEESHVLVAFLLVLIQYRLKIYHPRIRSSVFHRDYLKKKGKLNEMHFFISLPGLFIILLQNYV